MEGPDLDALVGAALELARRLAVAPPSEDVILDALERVLFARRNHEAARLRIITADELIDLVIAHLVTLISDDAAGPSPAPWEAPDLRDLFRAAIFP